MRRLEHVKRVVPIVCLFASGFGGLVYEVCCIRVASLAVGSTTVAVGTVLAVFFGGLAIGSWLFGRIAGRTTRPLRLYGVLELGVAAAAAATPFAFHAAEPVYGGLHRALAGTPPLLGLGRAALVAIVLLPATILMGGTLPLFARYVVARADGVARPVGIVYAVNTLGAAAGCAVTGLWLLPTLGVTASFMLGAGLSAAAGVVVVALRAAPITATEPAAPDPDPAAAVARHRRTVTVLFFLIGFASLGTQVLWTRFLALVVRNTVHTYTITLTIVLVGIVAGSLLAAWLFDRAWPRGFLFGAMQVATGLTVLVTMLLPPEAWQAMGGETAVCLLLMLLPAVLSGASFPLAVRMVLHDPALAGRRVGAMLAVNTLGGLLGALIVGTLVLPAAGLHPTLLILTGLMMTAGLVAWMLLPGGMPRRPALAASAAAALLWIALPPLTGTRLPADFLAPVGRLVDHREGAVSSVAVVADRDVLRLEIDRWWQGQNRKGHQIMAAHVPALLHPDPRRVLVVGVGAGQTPARFLMHDIERLDCVDIEPAVFELIDVHFESGWMHDARTRLIRDDGRSFVAHADETYDIISIEVGQLFRPGVATFYTADFYEHATARLAPGGLLVQFVPLPFFGEAEFRSVIATFVEALPASVLWYNTSELLLIGTAGERIAIDAPRLARLSDDPTLHEDLRFSHWGGPAQWLNRPESFLAGFLCGPESLAELGRGGGILRDDRPTLEYAAGRVRSGERRELPLLELIGTRLDDLGIVLTGAPPPLDRAEVDALRASNLGDAVTAAYLRQVENLAPTASPSAIADLLAEGLRHNPDNVEANRRLADAIMRSGGDPANAEPFFRRALAVRPDDTLSQKGLAFVLLATDRPEEAAGLLEAVVAARPDDAVAHNFLGTALARTNDLPGAITHFRQALAIDPSLGDARRNLDRALQAAGG